MEGRVSIFRRTRPALVITDLVMPDKEGIETIRELRQAAPTVPILAISRGTNHPIYLRAATKLGATEALDKPFGNEELLAVVTRLLKTIWGPFAERQTRGVPKGKLITGYHQVNFGTARHAAIRSGDGNRGSGTIV